MLDLAGVAKRLAVCFASGRVDKQTSDAIQTLFPNVEAFSVAVLAGGKLLVTADNMLKVGCLSVSLLRLDNTAAGAAMLTHNSCYANKAALRTHQYADAEKAITSGCTNFTSVPILAVLQPNTAASGPLVQEGMAALGAMSIGSSAPVTGRQLTQLMTLACLTSPFLSSYVSGMLQDLTSVFLAPSLAQCICGCGRPAHVDSDSGDHQGTDRRGSCRDADTREPDADDGCQSLTTSEREAEDLYAELVDLPAGFQVREVTDGGDSVGTIGQTLLARGYPPAGSPCITSCQPDAQLAAGPETCSGTCSSNSSSDICSSSSSESVTDRCSSSPCEQDGVISVAPLKPSKLDPSISLRQTNWLTFADSALEAQYMLRHGQYQAKVDVVFTMVIGAVLAVLLLEPYRMASEPLSPLLLVFLLPSFSLALSHSWYLKYRECVIGLTVCAMSAAIVTCAMPMFLTVLPASRLHSPLWVWRLLGCECAIVIPIGFMARLRTFIPMQLLNVAILAVGIPRTADAVFGKTAFTTQVRMLLFLAAVTFTVPMALIYSLERQARRGFLSSLGAAA